LTGIGIYTGSRLCQSGIGILASGLPFHNLARKKIFCAKKVAKLPDLTVHTVNITSESIDFFMTSGKQAVAAWKLHVCQGKITILTSKAIFIRISFSQKYGLPSHNFGEKNLLCKIIRLPQNQSIFS
jgi:hypothetical protein